MKNWCRILGVSLKDLSKTEKIVFKFFLISLLVLDIFMIENFI